MGGMSKKNLADSLAESLKDKLEKLKEGNLQENKAVKREGRKAGKKKPKGSAGKASSTRRRVKKAAESKRGAKKKASKAEPKLERGRKRKIKAAPKSHKADAVKSKAKRKPSKPERPEKTKPKIVKKQKGASSEDFEKVLQKCLFFMKRKSNFDARRISPDIDAAFDDVGGKISRKNAAERISARLEVDIGKDDAERTVAAVLKGKGKMGEGEAKEEIAGDINSRMMANFSEIHKCMGIAGKGKRKNELSDMAKRLSRIARNYPSENPGKASPVLSSGLAAEVFKNSQPKDAEMVVDMLAEAGSGSQYYETLAKTISSDAGAIDKFLKDKTDIIALAEVIGKTYWLFSTAENSGIRNIYHEFINLHGSGDLALMERSLGSITHAAENDGKEGTLIAELYPELLKHVKAHSFEDICSGIADSFKNKKSRNDKVAKKIPKVLEKLEKKGYDLEKVDIRKELLER